MPQPPHTSPFSERPLFMIGVAAELAGMHPQTLRLYERRGFVSPRRTARNTRLYSEADVAQLRRVQQLSEAGLNLAGIERVMELERRLARAELRAAELEDELARQAEAARQEREALRRSLRGELVHVPRAGAALVTRYLPVVSQPRRKA